MCFETTKSARAKIAKTDIECWKVINRDHTNAFGHIPPMPIIKYKTGKKQRRVIIVKDGYQIFMGYHSFREKEIAAYHLTHPKWNYDYNKERMVKMFIIPAGTRYYENKTEYVSETIMLVK